ncbi:MAG: hypothetical protein QMB94_13105 [Phycisphaerales bacterium]
MHVDVRTQDGTRLGRVKIDQATRPIRVRPGNTDRDTFLEWENAVDDAGHLRACITCGNRHLYRSRSLPQVTPFVALIALAGATVSLLGFATSTWILNLLIVVLVIDIGVLVFARTRLVCYRCGSIYGNLPIARYHRRWDPAVAEKIANEEDPADSQRLGRQDREGTS